MRENIDFYGRIYGLDPDLLKRRRSEVLELTSLTDNFHQLAGTLSGGWQRRLALACALFTSRMYYSSMNPQPESTRSHGGICGTCCLNCPAVA